MNNINNLSTLDIVKSLENLTEETIFSSDAYILLKELCYRQIKRIDNKLCKTQRSDLSHIVATNMLIFLSKAYKTGFKVSNWIKYTYNRCNEHYIAIYDLFGNEKPQILDIVDTKSKIQFLNRYYLQHYVSEMQDNVINKADLHRLGLTLFNLIRQYCRYNKSYIHYELIINSVFSSICLGKMIYLYGLKKFEKDYVYNLTQLIKYKLPKVIYHDLQIDNNMEEIYNQHLQLLLEADDDKFKYYV